MLEVFVCYTQIVIGFLALLCAMPRVLAWLLAFYPTLQKEAEDERDKIPTPAINYSPHLC